MQTDTVRLGTAVLKGRDMRWNQQIYLCDTTQQAYGWVPGSLQENDLTNIHRATRWDKASPFLTLALCVLNLYHSKCAYMARGELQLRSACMWATKCRWSPHHGEHSDLADVVLFPCNILKTEPCRARQAGGSTGRLPPPAPRYLSSGRRRPGRSGTRGGRPAVRAPPPRQPAGGGSSPPGSSSSAAPAGHTAAGHPDTHLTLGRPRPQLPDETALPPPALLPPAPRSTHPQPLGVHRHRRCYPVRPERAGKGAAARGHWLARSITPYR